MKPIKMDFIPRKPLCLYYHFGVYTKSGNAQNLGQDLCFLLLHYFYTISESIFIKLIVFYEMRFYESPAIELCEILWALHEMIQWD